MVKRKYSGGGLLQVFGERSAPMALSEIAELAGLPRVTARRIRFALAHGGHVSSDSKLFTATPHVLTLAGSYLRSNQLVAVLRSTTSRPQRWRSVRAPCSMATMSFSSRAARIFVPSQFG